MKLIGQQPIANLSSDYPRDRLLRDVKAQFHRLTVAVDELKGVGTVTTLDIALNVLTATTGIVDALLSAAIKESKK